MNAVLRIKGKIANRINNFKELIFLKCEILENTG